MIYIGDLSSTELLKKLWENAKTVKFYSIVKMPPQKFNSKEALASVNLEGYVDYTCSRAIKSKIFNVEYVDPNSYDSINGAGIFQKCVDELRAEKVKLQ
jgi:hypothetical protein